MHRIHAYPAKFPSFITTKGIQYAKDSGIEVKAIADIFCGCGTTAYEAKRNNIEFWGSDINPVATLIARSKRNKYSNDKIRKYYEALIGEFNRISIPTDLLETVNERIRYWFYETQIKDLYKLKNSILNTIPRTSRYHDLFLCAFSNILKPTSKWLTKSIKPQIDKDKKPLGVLEAFRNQVSIISNAISEAVKLSDAKSNIKTLNFINDTVPEKLVDMVITSPPYVTSYEYADLHQLSSIWLDFAKDYRELRDGTIGSIYHTDSFITDNKMLNKTGSAIVESLFSVNKPKARSVAKYFVDMQKTATKTFSVLKNKGLALFVIGNTELCGIRIDNAKHLSESLMKAGFTDIKASKRKISKKILTPYRDDKGRFTSDSKSRKVYSEEFIIIAGKN
ncbi:MAG: class I SAM-dependent methyltransferase [Spirochaetes bacterium]|nr:class I SAM-dependent methyltransferase [Spirochaetota bacterium]